MASLFASPDIAALVAAFPPPLPSKNQPSLVRSHSGNTLLNSRTVLDRFRTLLETEPRRFKREELPHRLGVERDRWVLECYNDSPSIRWSTNKEWLIPEPEWINVIEDLTEQCQVSLVDIGQFEREQHIEPFTDRDIDDLNEFYDLRSFKTHAESSDRKMYLASQEFVETARQEINSIIAGASDKMLNLSLLLPDKPDLLLKVLAEEFASDGQVETYEGDLVYVPQGYWTAEREKERTARSARMQHLAEAFNKSGFVLIDTSAQFADADDAYQLRHYSVELCLKAPMTLDVDDTIKLVILHSLLQRTLEELKDNATNLISNSITVSADSLNDEVKSCLTTTSSNPTLTGLVLKVDSCAEQVKSAIREVVQENEQKRYELFGLDFRREVFVPAQLYGAGMDSIVDPKLRQSLSEYVATYFKGEVIPAFVKPIREDGVISKDKFKMREIEKFIERAGLAKDTNDVLTVMTKLTKKFKISPPSEEEKRLVRRQILERKISKELPKMSRASDVLQNLVWILLSSATAIETGSHLDSNAVNGRLTRTSNSTQSSGGRLALFMSPGKDTGRMIKQYAAMAPDNSEMSKKLTLWREKLKSGSQTEDDLADMRSLAENIVRKVFGDEQLDGQ